MASDSSVEVTTQQHAAFLDWLHANQKTSRGVSLIHEPPWESIYVGSKEVCGAMLMSEYPGIVTDPRPPHERPNPWWRESCRVELSWWRKFCDALPQKEDEDDGN